MKWPTVTVETKEFGRRKVRGPFGSGCGCGVSPDDSQPDGTYMLVPADALVIVRDEDRQWPEWVWRVAQEHGYAEVFDVIDALAAAQDD